MRRAARSLLLTQSTLLQRGSSIGEALCIGASSTSDGPSSSHPLQEPLLLQFHQHQHHQQQSFSAVRHLSSLSSFWDNRFGRRAPASTAQQAAGDDASLAAQQEPSTWWPLPEGSDDALAAIAQAVRAGDLAAIAAAKQEAFFTSAWVMTGLQYFHDTQGLPWWGAIAALNLLTKLLTFPLALLSQKASAQTVDTQSKLAHIGTLQRAAQSASSPEEAASMQQAAQRAYHEHVAQHGSPFRHMAKVPAIMVANAAVFLSVFNGVRSLMNSKAHSLTVGGMLWFTDLTASDPYYGLPVMCAAATIAMVARGMNIDGMAVTEGQRGQQKMVKYMLYGAGLMFIPAGGMVPAGVGILWVSNSCFSVLQGMAMRDDRVRRLIGLPPMAEMREKNKLIAAQNQAASAPPAQAAAAEYDAGKAAQELLAKVQRDAQGKPVLFAQDPRASAGGQGRQRRASSGGGGRR